MTLSEVIKNFEIEAEMSNSLMIPYELRKKYSDDCKQMAEWLKELKEFRDIRQILSQNRIATDRYGDVVLWDDIKRVFEEVNADESNSNLGKE